MTARLSRAACIAGAATLLVIAAGCSGDPAPASGKRVVVLGFDGLDYGLTRTLLEQGRLPNFARLAAGGGFSPLTTTIPPQSPVAWSTLITGLDPGGHGIFDFIHRDPKTMVPYLSTTRTAPSDRVLTMGGWQFPLTGGTIESLRHGQPFWELLEARGIETTIMRMPANFPPSGSATRELSGMGTPDLLGTYGTFSFYTSDPYAFGGAQLSGGAWYPVAVAGNVVRSQLHGPPNAFRTAAEPVTSDFTLYIDAERPVAKLVVGEEERVLSVGDWTDWIPVEFDMRLPLQTLRGIARFYLKQVRPHVELYVSPINLDPLAPALPVSAPDDFAAELAATTGRFYTQGIPEDTQALKQAVLSRDEFLSQARVAADENRRQYRHVLSQFRRGLLFHYFGNVDQVAHMMFRARDPGHPAYDPATDPAYATVIETLYTGLDAIVGETLDALDEEDTLVVLSDHGFTSWRRTFHLNAWLTQEAFLTLANPARQDDPGFFGNVDWSRTRAYGLGLNGLYINLKGREMAGTVDPADRERVIDDIAARLLNTVDPATGAPAVTKVYRRDQVYRDAGLFDRAPDLVIGYAKGTRGSDASALGGIGKQVITDNTDPWNGDHCMDHEAVPGVLLSNRPLRKPAPSLDRVAAAVLAEFGIEQFPVPAGAK
ncbi:MAG TPA: alkaline phosphatase family protein [Vicinamibacterales bacterium]|nr:alkaline phosphatase family protein [Vicinamibacterales bacterium]